MSKNIYKELSLKILNYLLENPRAEDTLEGIVQWWILEKKIDQRIEEVKKAIQFLASQGLVVEVKDRGPRVLYKMNQDRLQDILKLLKKKGKK